MAVTPPMTGKTVLITGAIGGIGRAAAIGLATGVAVGLLQWRLVLRGRLPVASLWPLVVAVAWPHGLARAATNVPTLTTTVVK